jgi:hypothetical protein
MYLGIGGLLQACGYRPPPPPAQLGTSHREDLSNDLIKLRSAYRAEDRHSPHRKMLRNDVLTKSVQIIHDDFRNAVKSTDDNSGFVRSAEGFATFALAAVAVFVRPTWPSALVTIFKGGDTNLGSTLMQEYADPKAWGRARDFMFAAKEAWLDDFRRKMALPDTDYSLEFASITLDTYWALGHPGHAEAWMAREKPSGGNGTPALGTGLSQGSTRPRGNGTL